MLRVLAAARSTPEVDFTDNDELVEPASLCGRLPCACCDVFVRVASRLPVQVAEVVEYDISVEDYRAAFRRSLASRSHQDADQAADQLLSVTQRWPVGTTFVLRGQDLLVDSMRDETPAASAPQTASLITAEPGVTPAVRVVTASVATEYAIKLHLDTGPMKIAICGARDVRSMVSAVLEAERASTANIVWVKRRPTCDYCDQPGTRYVRDSGTVTPLCPACARDHYGTDAKAATGTLGITRFDEVNPAEWTDKAPDSYLDSPSHQWILEPSCSDDARAVFAELLVRQYVRDGRVVADDDVDHVLLNADVNHLLAGLLAHSDGEKPMQMLDRFVDLLTQLSLPMVSRGDELTIILLGAQGLHHRAIGTPAQSLDTAMTWYYG